jgi:hypothetical protein
MRIVKIVAMVIAGLAVISLWFASYVGGQKSGYGQGYDTGYAGGHDKGYAEGYDIGHGEGYDKGYKEGYDAGQEGGYVKGYKESYDAGYEEILQTGKALINPSYQEMKDFLQRDLTDHHSFEGAFPGGYDCENYASDVVNNAEAESIRAAMVILEYEKGGHAVVAFETTDRGLIFIEPQNDKEIVVKEGVQYGGIWGEIIKKFVVCW